LDVLSICSPNHCHVDQVIRALEAGQVRALWIEKPFAPTQGEAETIRQLASRHQVQLLINFQRRFDPVLLALRERLRTEDIRLVRGLYHKGWSHIGTTLVDLTHFLFGRPDRVEARSRGAIGAEDLILDAQLHWEGFTGHLLALDSEEAPSPCHVFDLEIFTARERILITDNSRRILVHPIGDYAYGDVKVYLPEAEIQQTEYDQSMVHATGFLEAFLRGDQPWSERPLLDSLEVCATVQAGLEAARQNMPTRLPPVPLDLEML
jgi:predicted dehydrogenase